MEHHGCSGHSKPTRRQVTEVEVARAAVTANPKASAKSVMSQVQQTSGMAFNQRMMYRAQEVIKEDIMGDYAENFKKLPSLLEEFCRVNCGSHQAFGLDSEGRYKRAFLSHPHI
ncbi:unnamed protein product [Aphanomyces euteiches]